MWSGFRSLASIVIGVSLAAACATAPRASTGSSSSSSHPNAAPSSAHAPGAKEAADYKELQTLYERGAYEALVQKTLAFEKRHPRSGYIANVRNFQGLGYLLTRRSPMAAQSFRSAIEASPQPTFRQYVLYNLAAALHDAGQLEEAQQTLAETAPESLDRDTRVKYHALRARIFVKLGMPVESVREALRAGRVIDSDGARAQFARLIEEALQGIANVEALEDLYADHEDAPGADLVLYRLGAQEITLGRMDPGETHLRTLMARFPRTVHYADAADLLRAVQNQSIVDSTAIGVLLPLKGKNARFGLRSLQGIQLAFRIFNTEEPDSGITLVIEDSGEDPESAVRGLNNLYFKHHVSAVIGPMLSKGIDQVTQRAQELGLPLVSLAQLPGTPGDNVFQAGLSPRIQAQEVARYAIEKLGLKRFAILYPQDKFGELYSQSYWDAVESLGGKIVGIESYAPNETDFRQQIAKLSGLHYADEARKRELEALAKEREANNIKKRTRRTEKFYALPPVVDYDAVFIPDQAKVVGQILPTFAYQDVDGVKFLGTSTWNSAELLTRASSYAEGAVFADAFFAESASAAVKKFLARYRATFGQDPGAIEALAYDAASLVEQAARGTKTRVELRERLKAVAGFPGITGKIAYRDGQFTRNLTMLTVRGGRVSELR
jgi:ABC-type branched-subunit amino acid transport system substrate-binding protein